MKIHLEDGTVIERDRRGEYYIEMGDMMMIANTEKVCNELFNELYRLQENDSKVANGLNAENRLDIIHYEKEISGYSLEELKYEYSNILKEASIKASKLSTLKRSLKFSGINLEGVDYMQHEVRKLIKMSGIIAHRIASKA